MRKLWLALLFTVIAFPLWAMSVRAADVTDVNWVTRNDAPIPFVRVVLSLTAPVDASASIDKAGTTTTVQLKNVKLKTDDTSLTMDPKIVTKAHLKQSSKNVNIVLNTPNSIDVGDIKVFSLKKDKVNNKPDRMVIDIQQKGVAPRSVYYGSTPKVTKSTATSTVNTDKKSNKKSSTTNTSTQPAKTPTVVATASQPKAVTVDYKTSGGIAGKVITIDPGHGGSDPGAIGPTGLMEKNVTLPISMKLKKALEAKGAKVNLTRTTDVDVYGPNASGPDELQARVDVGTANKSDIFISVHINSFSNPSVGGISTYYYDKTQYDTRLASRIQAKIADEAGFGGDRGIQPGNLYVLRRSLMPAVLVELGFISNPKEEALLKSDAVQQEFADEIADGIENYFRG
ncbi:N-acetylmuramoyl-L-alanine amidase [Veillonella sp.]|uniref:N-acetylmuramoyl-L-alanine amidase family protein n=2 Tax=Veillonella TaxID=29465 RepID=UPI0025D59AD0|nr:N-acetylmuramoyl-L-alanine amidase [Veillonella sp.]